MDTLALEFLFSPESEIHDPFEFWINFCINNQTPEKDIVRNLLQIENMCYCENVWYYSILNVLIKRKIQFPILKEYVQRRDSQYEGKDFSTKQAKNLVEKLGIEYF